MERGPLGSARVEAGTPGVPEDWEDGKGELVSLHKCLQALLFPVVEIYKLQRQCILNVQKRKTEERMA